MYFCPIAPTAELDRYAGRSSHQLCLAQFAQGSAAAERAYFEWYRGRVAKGDVVILDSGGYEGHTPNIEEYIRLALELRPTVVTIPDALGDAEETKRLAGAYRLVKPRKATWEDMRVVQQSADADLLYWMREYQKLSTYKWIALPRLLGARRVEFIRALQYADEWHEAANHHAFGMNAGAIEELPQLNALGVYSCDSSAPVWRALVAGHRIGTPERWADYPFDPKWHEVGEVGRANKIIADYNLTEVFAACQLKLETPSTIVAAPTSSPR